MSSLHGFLFSLIIFFSKEGRTKTLVFINLLIFVISINNAQFWVLSKDFFAEYYYYALVPWQFLIAPFFYMFLIHYLEIDKKSKNILKLVMPVFLVLIAIRMGFVYFFNFKSTIDHVFFFKKYTAIEEIFNLVSSLSIFGYTYYILSKKEKLFARIISYDNLKWIYNFFKLGALTYLFWMIALTITIALNYEEVIYSYYPLRILTTILVYWLGYEAVLQLRRLNEKKYLRKQVRLKRTELPTEVFNDIIILTESNTGLEISKEVIDTVLKGLAIFEQQHQYTSNKITLSYLAKKLNTNSNYLSKIVNHYKKNSFTNYLNELRINSIVYQLETNVTIRKFSIKAVAEEAGFNNASSFSCAFVKIKGVKPSKFVKELNKKGVKKIL